MTTIHREAYAIHQIQSELSFIEQGLSISRPEEHERLKITLAEEIHYFRRYWPTDILDEDRCERRSFVFAPSSFKVSAFSEETTRNVLISLACPVVRLFANIEKTDWEKTLTEVGLDINDTTMREFGQRSAIDLFTEESAAMRAVDQHANQSWDPYVHTAIEDLQYLCQNEAYPRNNRNLPQRVYNRILDIFSGIPTQGFLLEQLFDECAKLPTPPPFLLVELNDQERALPGYQWVAGSYNDEVFKFQDVQTSRAQSSLKLAMYAHEGDHKADAVRARRFWLARFIELFIYPLLQERTFGGDRAMNFTKIHEAQDRVGFLFIPTYAGYYRMPHHGPVALGEWLGVLQVDIFRQSHSAAALVVADRAEDLRGGISTAADQHGWLEKISSDVPYKEKILTCAEECQKLSRVLNDAVIRVIAENSFRESKNGTFDIAREFRVACRKAVGLVVSPSTCNEVPVTAAGLSLDSDNSTFLLWQPPSELDEDLTTGATISYEVRPGHVRNFSALLENCNDLKIGHLFIGYLKTQLQRIWYAAVLQRGRFLHGWQVRRETEFRTVGHEASYVIVGIIEGLRPEIYRDIRYYLLTLFGAAGDTIRHQPSEFLVSGRESLLAFVESAAKRAAHVEKLAKAARTGTIAAKDAVERIQKFGASFAASLRPTSPAKSELSNYSLDLEEDKVRSLTYWYFFNALVIAFRNVCKYMQPDTFVIIDLNYRFKAIEISNTPLQDSAGIDRRAKPHSSNTFESLAFMCGKYRNDDPHFDRPNHFYREGNPWVTYVPLPKDVIVVDRTRSEYREEPTDVRDGRE
jgi:hypothetical protein